MPEMPQKLSVVSERLFGQPDPRGTKLRRKLERVERETGAAIIIHGGGKANGVRLAVLESIARAVLADQLKATPSEELGKVRGILHEMIREQTGALAAAVDALSARVDSLRIELSELKSMKRRDASARESTPPTAMRARAASVEAAPLALPYLTPTQVARALMRSPRAAKRFVQSLGIAERRGNGRWYVDGARLRDQLPDVYARVISNISAEPARSDRKRLGSGRLRHKTT